MTRTWLLVAVALAGSAMAESAAPSEFFFAPVPRWHDEPETEDACAAIRQECPALAKKDQIVADVAFDELYDRDGMLAGLRLTKSSGCKALDEYALVGHRHFRMAFHHDGQPDLDDVHLEVPAGVDGSGVRIVKRDGTQMNIGCD